MIKKRNRRKIAFRQVSKENYDLFRKVFPDIKIDRPTFRKIIMSFNEYFRDYILDTGDIVRYPYGMGEFTITKKPTKYFKGYHNPNTGKDFINLPVDWVKTKEYGKKIYIFNEHTNNWRCYWHWRKKSARITSSYLYYFKPCRITSRKLASYLKKPNSDKILELYQQRYH